MPVVNQIGTQIYDIRNYGIQPTGTDISAELNTLFNSVITSAGGLVRIPAGSYKILNNVTNTNPKTVLSFEPGAVFQVYGGTFRHLGGIDSSLWQQIFDVAAPGKVLFFPDQPDTWNYPGARIGPITLEMFGGKGDNVALDDNAWDTAWASVQGMPQTPLSTPSWVRGKILFRPGAIYVQSRPWIYKASIGFIAEGGGEMATQIIYRRDESATKFALDGTTPYPAANKVKFATIPAGNNLGRWLVAAGPTHWHMAQRIVAVNGNEFTTGDNHGWSSGSNVFYILDYAQIDNSGDFNVTWSDIGLSVTSGHKIMTGFYWHRDDAVTARGSSRGTLKNFNIDSNKNYYQAAFQIGSFFPGQTFHQEDLFSAENCKAFGSTIQLTAVPGTDDDLWDNNGWVFGSGSFSNPLNYTTNACVSVGWGNGIAQLATNVHWRGGTIQTNVNDIYLNNGAQSYASYGGFRSEGSHRLLYGFSPQSVGFSIHLYDIEFRGESMKLNVDTQKLDLISIPWAGETRIEGIRVIGTTLGDENDQLASNVPYTGIGTDGSGNGWVECTNCGTFTVDELKDEGAIHIFDTAHANEWRGRMYQIKSNTATSAGVTRFTVYGSFLRGAPGESGFDFTTLAPNGTTRKIFVFRVPRISLTGNQYNYIELNGILIPNHNHNQILGWSSGTADFDISGIPPTNVSGDPITWGRVSRLQRGTHALGYWNFGSATAQTLPSIWWTNFSHGRILLDGNFTIPLGGNAWSVDPTNYPVVPFPPKDGEMWIELTQDGTGGRTITFDTNKTIRWDTGAAPANNWPANRTRLYWFQNRDTYWIAKLMGEFY